MTTFEVIFSPISGGRILDVATGRGSFIHIMLESLKDYDEIIAIDSNDEFGVNFRETFTGKPITYQQMDASALNFADSSFDTVCISNSLHHMADPTRVLAEMQRVLKPSGTFIISEMMQDNLSEAQISHMLMHHWGASINRAEGIFHKETFLRQELMDFAKNTALNNWKFYDVAYLDDDPKDLETIEEIDGIIDLYTRKTEKLSDQEMLQKRGQAIREHVHEVGFHGATALVAIGIK